MFSRVVFSSRGYQFHTELGETALHQFPRRLSYPSLGSLTKCFAVRPYCLRGSKIKIT